MSESRRSKRVGELIRAELVQCLSSTVEDPILRDVGITDVELSPDLKVAKIFYQVEEIKKGESQKRLAAANGFFRKTIARGLDLRSVPELRFIRDDHVATTDRLMNLFKEIDHVSS